jgi:hypothetical protein
VKEGDASHKLIMSFIAVYSVKAALAAKAEKAMKDKPTKAGLKRLNPYLRARPYCQCFALEISNSKYQIPNKFRIQIFKIWILRNICNSMFVYWCFHCGAVVGCRSSLRVIDSPDKLSHRFYF